MDLLTGKIGKLYVRYLGAAFGSALITSVYGLVDMAMVGQYQGPDGTAALAVFAPVWNILYSLGLLTGIGGSVLFSTVRGRSGKCGREENEYFTAALIGTALFSAVSWLALLFYSGPLLRLFGAQETLLPLAEAYLKPIRYVIPVFLFNQMLAAFLRNDGACYGGGSVRRDVQCIRGLFLCLYAGYGDSGSRSGNGSRVGYYTSGSALSLSLPKKYAAPCPST